MTGLWLAGIGIVLLYACSQCLYLYYWKKVPLPGTAKPDSPIQYPSITVLVPARNEAAGIRACLQSLRQQDYPAQALRILLVDDASHDETAALAAAVEGVRVITNRKAPGKKGALATGFEEADTEWVICTDADCRFLPGWAAAFARALGEPGVRAWVGPVAIRDAEHDFARFQALDLAGMSLITGAALAGDLFRMASGACLAIHRPTFMGSGAYEGIDQVASGDDVLLVQKIERRYPGSVRYLKNAEAVAMTHALPGWSEFLRQRIRWGAKYPHYLEWQVNFYLGIPYLLVCSIFLLFILSIFLPGVWLLLMLLLAAKYMIDYILLREISIFHKRSDWLRTYWKSAIYHCCYIFIAGTASVLRWNVSWK